MGTCSPLPQHESTDAHHVLSVQRGSRGGLCSPPVPHIERDSNQRTDLKAGHARHCAVCPSVVCACHPLHGPTRLPEGMNHATPASPNLAEAVDCRQPHSAPDLGCAALRPFPRTRFTDQYREARAKVQKFRERPE